MSAHHAHPTKMQTPSIPQRRWRFRSRTWGTGTTPAASRLFRGWSCLICENGAQKAVFILSLSLMALPLFNVWSRLPPAGLIPTTRTRTFVAALSRSRSWFWCADWHEPGLLQDESIDPGVSIEPQHLGCSCCLVSFSCVLPIVNDSHDGDCDHLPRS